MSTDCGTGSNRVGGTGREWEHGGHGSRIAAPGPTARTRQLAGEQGVNARRPADRAAHAAERPRRLRGPGGTGGVRGLSQADIGRRLGLDRNDVSGIINRLQACGKVDRRADPADRRRNVVTLAPAGRQHLGELQRHADAVQAELLAGLDAAEQRQLCDLLANLLDSHQPQPA
ncbi:MarR family winged helix-turn-helix transcriptional regulator [Streptomyces sp. NPDC006290]|uniref:MarR family winged helix-turn-helix transcriptional regulator n=1 Tax=Streptomyces sp. NPDC006290 TaxID=3156745 RepID=UPI0033AC3633